MKPASDNFSPSSLLARHRDHLVLAVVIAAGALSGFQSAIQGQPEWCYWEALATQPWLEVVGPDKMLFGYLPGFAALIRPFFALSQPLGLLLFLAINAGSCWGIAIVLKRMRDEKDRPLPMALVVMLAIPMYLSLQNNQVVAPAVLLALCGVIWIMRGNSWGALALAIAALIKTMPVTLLLPLVLVGHWRKALLAALAVASLSIGFYAASEGIGTGLEAHLDLPAQWSAQNPNRILTDGEIPSSYSDNMSLSAVMIGLRGILGDGPTLLVNLSWFVGTLLLTLFATVRSQRREHHPMAWLGLWLSWTVLAAPFGRYYYLLLLTPTWSWLWPRAGGVRSKPLNAIACWLVALVPLASRSTEVYVAITVITYVFAVKNLLAAPTATRSLH